MKVVHLCTFPYGGAAIAARRIAVAERKIGIDAVFMTAADLGVDPALPSFHFGCLPHRFARKGEYWLKKLQRSTNPIMQSLGLRSLGLVNRINALEADILHLHWINEGLLSIKDVPRLSRPLVWTLHDTWFFSGAEHYPNVRENDRRCVEGYRKENFPSSSHGLDLDRWTWNRKRRHWKNLNCQFTTPSTWETQLFRESVIGQGRPCTTIPNAVPLDVFRPYGPKLTSGKRVLFGACDINDPIKGGAYLLEALALLKLRHPQVELVCFGSGAAAAFAERGISVKSVGMVSDVEKMAELYRSADVFVCPSVIENLPNTCVESTATGTPVAAFSVGGIPDIVTHLRTGYLAKPYDVADLADGIAYCLKHAAEMSPVCRASAEEKFAEELVATRFRDLYTSRLNSTSCG